MATPAATFPKAAFAGIEFPYETIQIKGGIRHTLHEFPHAPGAELEKMGRRAYVVTFRTYFHDLPGSSLARQYPDLYPRRLQLLRQQFDAETTDKLVIPNVGTIKACATNWTHILESRIVSGESAEFEFTEDQEAAMLDRVVRDAASKQALIEANDRLFMATALADFKKESTQSIFQDISDAVTSVQGVFGQADAYSRMVEGKLQAVVNLCSWADGQLTEMQDPVNHLVLDAIKDVWFAAKSLAENVTQTRSPLRKWSVPKKMPIGEVSICLYGTTERGVDIMNLNAIDDPLAIPAGTVLVVEAA